jgi:hypothetical protein
MLQYDKGLKQFSRTLRKNMTDAEILLWAKIRGGQLKGHQFYRQKVIGNYIVDFYCPKAKLTTSQKVLFMAVIPEVLNRESILFKKLRAPGFPPSRE